MWLTLFLRVAAVAADTQQNFDFRRREEQFAIPARLICAHFSRRYERLRFQWRQPLASRFSVCPDS